MTLQRNVSPYSDGEFLSVQFAIAPLVKRVKGFANDGKAVYSDSEYSRI
jgi:hypothetical protein